MNKPTIIYLLLLFSFFTSSLGDECSDFDDAKSFACRSVILEASGKSCVYINDECKEQIAECDLYTGTEASECEAIIPHSDPYRTKCVFKDQKCQSEEKTSCSDYKSGQTESFCNRIPQSDGASCHLENNECKSYYAYCEANGAQNKETCESIKLKNPYKYCSFSTEKGCETKQKEGITCSSFESGQDLKYCEGIELENGKHCVFYNNKCTEYFEDCNDASENECNSNIPEERNRYKCLYKEGKCTQVQKTCSDYDKNSYDYCENIKLDDEKKECRIINGQCAEADKRTKCSDYQKGEDYDYCEDIILSDDKKYCVLTNNECKESYRYCSDYTGTDAEVCNSIITQNSGMCVYDNGCKDKTMKCSEYTSILDIEEGLPCTIIHPSNILKKCTYSNHNCNEEDKYCTDFTSYATKEICEKAPTSSKKKKCVLSDDNRSCVEKDGAYFIKAFSSLLFLLLL
jgi:hypothetical protein